MVKFLVFLEAMMSSLDNAKNAYATANDMDVQNGGEDFKYEQIADMVSNYVVSEKEVDVNKLKDEKMADFIVDLMELANKNAISEESLSLLFNEDRTVVSKDFAKKSFLILLSGDILTRIAKRDARE